MKFYCAGTCVMELIIFSCVRGYHVYGEIWSATLGEELLCVSEVGNVVDRYAVAVKKDSGETVGHLPQKILRMCSMFILRGGGITATVTGHRKYSWDLVQGGLEIPCNLKFRREEDEIRKLKKLLQLKRKLNQLFK